MNSILRFCNLTTNNARLLLLVLFVAPLMGCAKRPSSFIPQEQTYYYPPPKTMTLPVIRNLRLEEDSDGKTVLSWDPILTPHASNLVGYNIYRFYKKGFLGSKPINSSPITSSQWSDPTPQADLKPRYALRGVFSFHGSSAMGPLSRIVGQN